MTELAFQRAFARFLTSTRARSAVLAAEPGPGDDPEIVDRLRQLDPERTELFSKLLVLNRLAKIQESLPLTVWALQPQLWPVMLRFNEAHPPLSPKKNAEAKAFGAFLTESLSAETVPAPLAEMPDWLPDVVDYERTVLDLRFSATAVDHLDGAELAPAGGGPAVSGPHILQDEGFHPHLSPSCRLIGVRHDIEQVIEACASDQRDAVIEPREAYLLIQVLGDGRAGLQEVSAPVALFLSLCTGEPGYDDVVATAVSMLSGPDGENTGLKSDLNSLTATLIDSGVLQAA